jgi:hypothetical protein
MKSAISLATAGGAFANLWKGLPLIVKVPFVVGVVALASAELTRDVNQALRSGRVTEAGGGQARRSRGLRLFARAHTNR